MSPPPDVSRVRYISRGGNKMSVEVTAYGLGPIKLNPNEPLVIGVRPDQRQMMMKVFIEYRADEEAGWLEAQVDGIPVSEMVIPSMSGAVQAVIPAIPVGNRELTLHHDSFEVFRQTLIVIDEDERQRLAAASR
jgi:hypothetical protein